MQAASDRIDPYRIQEPLDSWTFMPGAKFSRHEREGIDLRRYYYLSQVEYAQNIIFKRNHPIHSIFERSCDLGLARITPQRMAHIFGWTITKGRIGCLPPHSTAIYPKSVGIRAMQTQNGSPFPGTGLLVLSNSLENLHTASHLIDFPLPET